MTDLAPWQWALLLGVVGPLIMLVCAVIGGFVGLAAFFFFEPPPRCPTCYERMPTYYAGRRYVGEVCPACAVQAAVKGARA
jgi:hypothetical protein